MQLPINPIRSFSTWSLLLSLPVPPPFISRILINFFSLGYVVFLPSLLFLTVKCIRWSVCCWNNCVTWCFYFACVLLGSTSNHSDSVDVPLMLCLLTSALVFVLLFSFLPSPPPFFPLMLLPFYFFFLSTWPFLIDTYFFNATYF